MPQRPFNGKIVRAAWGLKFSVSSLLHSISDSDSRRDRRLVWKEFLDLGGEFK